MNYKEIQKHFVAVGIPMSMKSKKLAETMKALEGVTIIKSFEEHLRGAKAHNREDKIWLVTCFSGEMAKLCAKYGFPMMKICSSSIEHFVWIGLSYTVMTIPYIAEEMAVATDKTRYKDVKVRIPEKNWLY